MLLGYRNIIVLGGGSIISCHRAVDMLGEVVSQVNHRGVIVWYRCIVLRKGIGESCILLDETSVIWNGIVRPKMALLIFTDDY